MKLRHLRLCSSVAVFAALPLAATAAQPAPAPAPRPAPGQPAKPGAKEDGAAEVVVTGTRAEVVASTDRISFSVANDLQVQTGSVADALRVVPGVDVDLQGNVSLRGDPGVTILIDGRPSAMLRGDSRGDVLLSMPAGQLERVEVISNPSAALSPEGSGGVINLVTKQVKKDTRSATVRVTIGPEGRGGINLSGAQSGNGLTLTGDVGYRRITGEASGIQQRARLDPGSGTFVTSRQDTELDTVNAARTARVGIEYDPDKKNRLSTDFNYREFSSDVDRGDRFVSQNAASSYNRDSDIALSQRGIGARASWRHTLGKEHDFVADLEVEKGRLRRGVDAVTDFDAGPLSFERIRNAGERSEYNLKLDYKRPLGDESSLNLGYHVNIGQSEFDSAGIRGGSLETLLRVPGSDQQLRLRSNRPCPVRHIPVYRGQARNAGGAAARAGRHATGTDHRRRGVRARLSAPLPDAAPRLHPVQDRAASRQLQPAHSAPLAAGSEPLHLLHRPAEYPPRQSLPASRNHRLL
jgi:hypothetical protein